MDVVQDQGAAAPPGDLEAQYRKAVVDQFGRLTFRGISRASNPLSLPLEDIYVELKAVADVPEAADTYSAEERRLLVEAQARGQHDSDVTMALDSLRLERWRQESREGQNRFQRRSIVDSIADPARPGLVILGDPGSGKTTLLHYLALEAAKVGLSDGAQSGSAEQASASLRSAKGAARLPIFVPLAAYDDWLRRNGAATPLGRFLALYFENWRGFPNLGPLFRQALDEGRALVLLDGLDEVLDVATRQHVANQAQALLQQEAGRGNRFVLTSRIVGYREAPLPGDLPHVTVLDFGEGEIETFARKWCEASEAWFSGGRTEAALRRAADETKALLDEVRANDSVLRLAANPLLLTMLALLRRQGGKLPEQRVRLYERYVETLLENNWENVRSEGARTQEPDRFDRGLATDFLIELALWLQKHKPSGTARRRELEEALVGIALRLDGVDPSKASPKQRREAQGQATLFLKDMRHFAGLLAERGQDAFGFLHLTFQEYFAGRALARMDAEERWALLRGNLHGPRWLEPIRLCAGQLGIVERRGKAVSDLAHSILNAGSLYDDVLHRDVFLACSIAADKVGLDRGLLEELARQLVKLVESRVRKVRMKALNGLGQLAHLGLEEAERWLECRIRSKENYEETARAVGETLRPELCKTLRQAFCAWLDDSSEYVVSEAIDALATLMTSDEDMGRVIAPKMDARMIRIRLSASRAMTSRAARDPELRRRLLDALDDIDTERRRSALWALGPLVSTYPEILRRIASKLDDPESGIRDSAIYALKPMVAADVEIQRLITKVLDDREPYVRQAAIVALAPLITTDAEIRRLLLSKLDSSNMNDRRTAIASLAPMVTTDKAIYRLILTKLDDSDGYTRKEAVKALSTQVSVDMALRGRILAKLDDETWNVRHTMVRAIAPLAITSSIFADQITAALDDQDSDVRSAAVKALVPLAEDNAAIRQLIIGKLNDPSEDVVRTAIQETSRFIASEQSVRDIVVTKIGIDNDLGVDWYAIRALAPLVASNASIRGIFLSHLTNSAVDHSKRSYIISELAHRGVPLFVDSELRNVVLEHLGKAQFASDDLLDDAIANWAATDAEVRNLIVALLRDRDELARPFAIAALAPLVSDDEEIRSLIMELISDQHENVREEAVRALAGLVNEDTGIRRLIIERLGDEGIYTRRAAVNALAPLVDEDIEIQDLIRLRLVNDYGLVRAAAIDVLAPLVIKDEENRRLVADCLQDKYPYVRRSAIRALSPLVRDADVRCLIEARLVDPAWEVRLSAVESLATLIPAVRETQIYLLPWIGLVGNSSFYRMDDDLDDESRTRRLLVQCYAPLLSNDPAMAAKFIDMLRSPAWPSRMAAAWVLAAGPGGPPAEALPIIGNLLNDQRAEESWRVRLYVAEALINDVDPALSMRAVEVTTRALEYGTQPWYGLTHDSANVRAEAVRIFGQLKPIYRNDAIFERLLRVLSEDVDPDVVDAAYAALLRLAVAPEADHDMESYLNASRGSREPSISLSSPGTGMPPLPSSLILHLSDLHFGTRQDATSWYNQLAEDLTQELRVSRLNAVILSGDIANWSTPEEYDAAQHFFNILAREFHVSAPQIILVPGNHDLNWGLAKKAYKLMDREEHKGELKDGHFIPAGEDAIRVRDEDLYKQRFAHFAEFYKAVRGEAYPLEYPEQAILYPIPAANLLILGLNSAWELDHHFSKRAGIHREALNAALTKLRMSPDDIKNCLKIAVWHHPIHSGAEDRITEGSFLEQLAKAEFRLALHGHVHKADANIFTYDKSPAGRRLDIVCAGTFGAPVKEWVPGYPLQYNLLRFEGNTLTVETRRREEPNGAWKPDARWLRGPGQDPAPRYSVELFASA